jgi:hypothetical protein
VIATTLNSQGVQAALTQYRTLRAEQANEYEFTEFDLNALGYSELSKGNTANVPWQNLDGLQARFFLAGPSASLTLGLLPACPSLGRIVKPGLAISSFTGNTEITWVHHFLFSTVVQL